MDTELIKALNRLGPKCTVSLTCVVGMNPAGPLWSSGLLAVPLLPDPSTERQPFVYTLLQTHRTSEVKNIPLSMILSRTNARNMLYGEG